MQSRLLNAWVFAVLVAAVALLAGFSAGDNSGRLDTLLAVVAAAAVVGGRTVHVRVLRIELTPIHPFILVALAVLGPLPAALTCVAGVTGAAIGSSRPTVPIRFVFNLGSVLLSTGAAARVFAAAHGDAGRSLEALLWPLTLAAVTFALVNTLLVSVALTLEKRGSFFPQWTRMLSCTAGSSLAGLSTAFVMLAVLDVSLLWAFALGAAPCWLLVIHFRQNAARQAEIGGRSGQAQEAR